MRGPSKFQTRDLNVASFLFANGAQLTEVCPIGPGKVEYFFSDRKACESLALQFCSGQALINPRAFVEGMKRARDCRDVALSNLVATPNQDDSQPTR